MSNDSHEIDPLSNNVLAKLVQQTEVTNGKEKPTTPEPAPEVQPTPVASSPVTVAPEDAAPKPQVDFEKKYQLIAGVANIQHPQGLAHIILSNGTVMRANPKTVGFEKLAGATIKKETDGLPGRWVPGMPLFVSFQVREADSNARSGFRIRKFQYLAEDGNLISTDQYGQPVYIDDKPVVAATYTVSVLKTRANFPLTRLHFDGRSTERVVEMSQVPALVFNDKEVIASPGFCGLMVVTWPATPTKPVRDVGFLMYHSSDWTISQHRKSYRQELDFLASLDQSSRRARVRPVNPSAEERGNASRSVLKGEITLFDVNHLNLLRDLSDIKTQYKVAFLPLSDLVTSTTETAKPVAAEPEAKPKAKRSKKSKS